MTESGRDAAAAPDGPVPTAGYRRSTGSRRGEARRRELLERVTADLASNGLVDFSLRRAARAAGTPHKVLLYHFAGADDLLRQAVRLLRERRISAGLAAAQSEPDWRLADRVRALWPVLTGEDSGQRPLDQAIGLAMYDPERYAELGHGVSGQYRPALVSLCPPEWTEQRKSEVAEMILAVLRGFLVDWRTAGETPGITGGFAALMRALDREESAAD